MTNEAIATQAEELARRAYTRLVNPDLEDGGYVVRFLEFPGIAADGDTLEEAWEEATVAVTGAIEAMISRSQSVPEPIADRSFSGRMQIRIPPPLHEEVTGLAAVEGISLNRWLSQVVADAVARRAERMPGRYWYASHSVLAFPVAEATAVDELVPALTEPRPATGGSR